MNYVIGLCQENTGWPHPFYDLDFKIALIEKSVRTSSGDIVVPDIIALSKRYLHSIAFECKGGNTINEEQVLRYSTLEGNNFVNWLDIHDREHMTIDVCFADIDSNHERVRQFVQEQFPMLTFHSTSLQVENRFRLDRLNNSFRNPISVIRTNAPISYYPFSEND